ncbi:MazG family protein [Cellulomonas dongxiuzhuiae]|uniref:MazG family protein n=1 Tax=Cellulomonas dongxiuzhuiae TaxID=2819979 RepID=A0ABX8GMS5_9CELL|nr:MazG family protein [Cellulomonas dongxiuzhuiae]MBO3096491.1 MazG family protein [Cellulomonas dongxiuzhuiae]QWC16886.1 MazG family protein [Cellulomonas dongxiuzhuiae]
MTTPGPGEVPRTARQADAVARAVAVLDRLRSPGGCPWYAVQTHASLLPYAVEEAHELVEAVEAGDRAGLREELGDVLLQVLVHARVAEEHEDDPFDVADVAEALVAKLVRRNPHVFAADGDGGIDVAAVLERWDRLKRAEKPTRTSALDGVPATIGALARAQKLVARADQAGLLAAAPPPTRPVGDAADVEALGDALLGLVAAAHRAGVDAEAALRLATATWEAAARRAEG